jgi:hypothetical protein
MIGPDIPMHAPAQRRQSSERRQRHLPWHIHCLLGRRQRWRRDNDRGNRALALDWHQSHLLYLTLATLLLCFADAHNTLRLTWQGAQEINGLMDYLIRKNTGLFIGVKMGVTALGLIMLISYQNVLLFRRLRVRYIVYGVFALYLLLIGYQIVIWPADALSIFQMPV